ncbi:PTS galactosamine/N-acetylgalactosamine transporter subunit IIA [Photobacterium sp. SP02]|uniref:PTS N-acetylgalactosamine transporter subunit IIA n=1 Tax=Photobacterium halotolerans TaxID=265726 RepID=A0A7X4WD01_9GAMM|nr:PTS galactosamine/N-acetylgalactosamine transporter subunit IIA [Photobacterium halotolerans]NAW66474.1 PTS N-acetylgalactosamine transporter subunit IIA [Photobacterium halotolerans]NAW85741.1 PTS N-acetylgalactosamine transporter subunit IIA [Photobacterium halotolerans]
MLGVVISGHGGFASGMEQAMLQVLGEQEQVVAIDFPPESTTQLLEQQFKAALEQVDSGDGIVFITDLLGGSPFRVASTLVLARNDAEVVTGANLQLILEMMMEREALNSAEFRVQALACGHRGMTSLADEIARQSPSKSDDEGI